MTYHLATIMNRAWAAYREATRYWPARSLPAARAAKWSTCLRRAWQEAKRAQPAPRQVARVLTATEATAIELLQAAMAETIYLPAHVSMARECRAIRAKIGQVWA